MFRFNAGKEGKSVPDYNPYTIRRCRDCDIAKGGKGQTMAFVPDNEVCAACRIVRALANADARQARKDAKAIQGSILTNQAFPHSILVTGASIKEWTNQPNKHFRAKNALLLNIAEALSQARYIGTADNHKGIKRVVQSHIFEIELCGEKNFIIVREYEWGEFVLHSISDSNEILKHIKRK